MPIYILYILRTHTRTHTHMLTTSLKTTARRRLMSTSCRSLSGSCYIWKAEMCCVIHMHVSVSELSVGCAFDTCVCVCVCVVPCWWWRHCGGCPVTCCWLRRTCSSDLSASVCTPGSSSQPRSILMDTERGRLKTCKYYGLKGAIFVST